MNLPTADELAALATFDTPTICNALEIVQPNAPRRGFTVRPLLCGFPDLPPIVGYARTATIRAKDPPAGSASDVKSLRYDYYRFVERGPRPTIIVMEDIDGADAGFGAFWGEVHSAVHKGLGAIGLITNGSIRDLPQWAPGFQVLAGTIGPSHAHANLVAFDLPVNVAGMAVVTGDLIHADRHGAVVVPLAAVRDLPAAARACADREAPIIAAARAADCSAEKLVGVMTALDAVH